MALMQRDMFVEADDRARGVMSDTQLAELVERLPIKPLLRVSDVTAALGCDVSVVYSWIDAGLVSTFRCEGGKAVERPSWRIFRSSLIDFLKTRINKV